MAGVSPPTAFAPHRFWELHATAPLHLRPLARQATAAVAGLVFERHIADNPLLLAPEYREVLCEIAAMHGVTPLLGQRAAGGATIVDRDVSAWLVEQAAVNLGRLQRTRVILDEVVAQTRRRAIDVVPLKGAALLLEGTEAVAWRVMGDIDLLVGPAPARELDLAAAYAGFCLSGASWKHRAYVACTQRPWPRDIVGEHPDHPINLELHPTVEEYFRGARWDLTEFVRAHLVDRGGMKVPDSSGMALHLAVHASIALLEGFGRIIHIVDLDRALSSVEPGPLVAAVRDAGLAEHARFAYPALAIVARETGNAVAREAAEALRPHVPPGMVAWAEQSSFYDRSYLGRFDRPSLDRSALWAISRRDWARMLGCTAFPSPAILASEQFEGEGPIAVAGWYPRYYLGLLRRLVGRQRR